MIQLGKWYRSVFGDGPDLKKPKPALESIFRNQPPINPLPDFSGIEEPCALTDNKPRIVVSSSISRFNRK